MESVDILRATVRACHAAAIAATAPADLVERLKPIRDSVDAHECKVTSHSACMYVFGAIDMATAMRDANWRGARDWGTSTTGDPSSEASDTNGDTHE